MLIDQLISTVFRGRGAFHQPGQRQKRPGPDNLKRKKLPLLDPFLQCAANQSNSFCMWQLQRVATHCNLHCNAVKQSKSLTFAIRCRAGGHEPATQGALHMGKATGIALHVAARGAFAFHWWTNTPVPYAFVDCVVYVFAFKSSV